ncbi:phage integrase N-terminal SAM-like domain-containing protein [Xanthomonas arboricola]|uniref:phage integrase N-terminal SAM-like domain-containing protein n=1 Tax=Xanthomonas arboricola TaxID=56448 RepID=UPI000E1E9A03|nr:phage integrase N-terminal SAM-like domain-containing protein [Xanthomonas arboricola]
MRPYHSDRTASISWSASGARQPSSAAPSGRRPARFLDRVCDRLRRQGRAKRIEDAYVGWIRRFILANGKRHPETMGVREVEVFLTVLAARDHVALSTPNQALAALLFLCREGLGRDLPWMDEIQRAKRPRRLPTVLSEAEVMAVLAQMEGRHALMAALLYGTGMRLMECMRLHINDVDVARNEIVVRDGESDSDALVPLALSLRAAMMQQCEWALLLRTGEVMSFARWVVLSHAVARKCPHADAAPWLAISVRSPRQWVDPRIRRIGRRHAYREVLQGALQWARFIRFVGFVA